MSGLANISAKKAVKAFERSGYKIERQKGSHIVLKAEGKPTLVIPNHREIAPYLLISQIKTAGLTVEEFKKLLR